VATKKRVLFSQPNTWMTIYLFVDQSTKYMNGNIFICVVGQWANILDYIYRMYMMMTIYRLDLDYNTLLHFRMVVIYLLRLFSVSDYWCRCISSYYNVQRLTTVLLSLLKCANKHGNMSCWSDSWALCIDHTSACCTNHESHPSLPVHSHHSKPAQGCLE